MFSAKQLYCQTSSCSPLYTHVQFYDGLHKCNVIPSTCMVLWNMDHLILWTSTNTHKWQNQCFILYWKMFNDRNKHAQTTHPVLTCCLALHKYSSMMDLHKCIAIVSFPDPTSRGSGNKTGTAKSCKRANIKLMYQRYISSGISRKGHSPES